MRGRRRRGGRAVLRIGARAAAFSLFVFVFVTSGAAAGSTVTSAGVTATPDVELSQGAVSCRGANLCFAVGSKGRLVPFIERWDGHHWSKNSVPAVPDADLSGVSCATLTSCFAVGSAGNTQTTLVEHWNGSRWARMTSPNRAASSDALTSVSCVSATRCFAVGSSFGDSQQRTLVEMWNGTNWAIMNSPNFFLRPNGGTESLLNSVSCATTTSCFAVGSTENDSVDDTFILGWDGRSWSISAQQNPDGQLNWLEGVSCATPTSCVAVGQDDTSEPTVPLKDVWNGKAWSLTLSPPANTEIDIDAVSCPTATSCLAVGSFGRAVAQRWNGTTWTAVAHPHPPGVIAVACISIKNCYGLGATTIQHWNGTSWSVAAQA